MSGKLTKLVYELDALAERDDGTVVPLSIRLFPPEDKSKRGYRCVCECPYTREEPYVIFGATEDHAIDVTFLVVRTDIMKSVVRLLDSDGNDIKLPRSLRSKAPPMTPLSREFFRFEAYAEKENGSVVPLAVWISQPEFDGDICCYCLVICPFIRLKPFFIFGVDEKQARELSFEFIRSLILHKSQRILDSSGREITLKEDAPFGA